jgi:hypothetical protein
MWAKSTFLLRIYGDIADYLDSIFVYVDVDDRSKPAYLAKNIDLPSEKNGNHGNIIQYL